MATAMTIGCRLMVEPIIMNDFTRQSTEILADSRVLFRPQATETPGTPPENCVKNAACGIFDRHVWRAVTGSARVGMFDFPPKEQREQEHYSPEAHAEHRWKNGCRLPILPGVRRFRGSASGDHWHPPCHGVGSA